MSPNILTALDFVGVISFTISGALVAVHKRMDYLGVCILGIVTAVGGGAFRDIIIGTTPPVMFRNPIYVAISFITANIVFLVLYFHINISSKPVVSHFFEKVLFWFDTIGLASFTVNGVIVGQSLAHGNLFLCSFLGVMTGVGGGIIRDLLANVVPAIFVKHIYAVASIAGAIATDLLWDLSQVAAISVGLFLVILIRFLGMHFKLNLPHIRNSK